METLRKIVKMKWMGTTCGILAGGLVGYGYYYFIGCNSGTCSITSNPINSTLYGTVMGVLLFWPNNKKKEKS